jgi:hypothetical protein
MRYTQEQMQVTVNEWQNSKLSKKEFCRERNINYPTFHYWYKRLKTPVSSGFMEVGVAGEQRSGTCELIFPSGARMMFNDQPSVSWLRELVR